MSTKEFVEIVWRFYDDHNRILPWRSPEADGTFNPYKILASECMLQQTQVSRVTPKYHAFLEKFPTLQSLAEARFADVLPLWSGLGYNRRAKYLHEAAGVLKEAQQPWSIEQLTSCKGIGYNTATAICVYAYNQAHVFVETNVRTVYIHHFFPHAAEITDKQISEQIKETLDYENPREFYWALMDYGTYLKKQGVRNASQSKHYTKQSRFEGSRRQVRGHIMRILSNEGSISRSVLLHRVADSRCEEVLGDLIREGMIKSDKENIKL